jgi:peptide/nickel transport system permease protein
MNRVHIFWARYCSNRAAVAGLLLLLAIVSVAIFGPLIYQTDPFDMVAQPFSLPFGDFLFGTDVSGRDIMAGIVHGAGVSLLIGLIAAITSTAIGVAFGAIAGYYGGWIDDVLMRITEYFLTIPSFVFAVVLVAIFSPTIVTVTTAIAIVSWPSVARLVRGEYIAQRNHEYVQACRAMGMRDMEIIVFQILPNTLPAVIVIGSLSVATAIQTEAGLSFLGLSDPNHVTWGYMVGVARTALFAAPWMIAVPGIAILLTVLAINLVGEGLNDALNPKLRRR